MERASQPESQHRRATQGQGARASFRSKAVVCDMSTVEQWAARVARAESAYATLNAVNGSMESYCDKAA